MKTFSPEQAKLFRTFFAETGYSEDHLNKDLGLSELPSRRLRNFPKLLDRTREPNCLNLLLRWFWIGMPVDRDDAVKVLPSWFVEDSLAAGLLRVDDGRIAPNAMIVPSDDLLIASDHTQSIESSDPQFVLWPNPTSRLLSRFMVRRHSARTFDFGTGNGILALIAARFSQHVIASDLNPRAAAFAEFNAALNSVENVEVTVGDGFAPARDQRFDLIVANPPFFITPTTRYLFCDNPMELDQMCRNLVREAANLLNEGGYFQMLCEWVQVEGQPWEERISEWFDEIGCDAWVMKGQSQHPSDYAQERISETNSVPEKDADLYRTYMDYYREKRVEVIHDGMIAIRRRSGKNWTLLEDVARTPKEPFGDAVSQRFAARDFLQAHTDDDAFLRTHPRLSPHVQLEQVLRQADGQWRIDSVTAKLSKGLPYSAAVQPLVAEFIAGCDGSLPLSALIDNFAQQVKAPRYQVQQECSLLVRTLLDRGFFTV